MTKKYYAVKNGRKTGIFSTWEECSQQVTGFSGAEYKGFASVDEAEEYLGIKEGTQGDGSHCVRSIKNKSENEHKRTVPLCSLKAIAYVDGSYDIATHRYSYGMIILYNGEEITQSEAFDDPELADMRNVAGEIKGAMEAMLYCIGNGIKELDIYYDYAGIEHWCTGAWKTNKPGTIAYKEYYNWAKKYLKIKFIKVKGHSGDKYNDIADKLAKQALGIE